MLPRFCWMKCFAASRPMSMAPVTLVVNTASKLARSISTSFLKTPNPALLTRMSRCPNAFRTSRIVRSTSASLATSARMGDAFNDLAASASFRSSRPVIATLAPESASIFAVEYPIPLLPPVTSAVAFCRFIFPVPPRS